MAFDDLDQAEQEDAGATDVESSSDDTDTTLTNETIERDGSADAVDRDPTPETTTEPEPTALQDPSDPAFGFDEARQRPLYARQEAWDAFEDALAIQVETALRRNDVRDAPKRELHDAALRVLADHADEVAEQVLSERGIDR
ncbi:hypothetical protein [Halobaculum marinum]|uniref:Uncharacterized protein n=1 Tax=Halobaculum marinum TaxID=3031996 RepID=A0ABD5X5L4_9EURY|nr:hypothetical protein [Halobaculum sp. DT55]